MGRWLLVALAACSPAATPHGESGAANPPVQSKLVDAYPATVDPGVRARVVCKMDDGALTKWSDVFIRDETIESCELIARAECEGRGQIVRPCSTDPLPGPLIARGVYVLSDIRPEGGRYEAFATAEECAVALHEREPPNATAAWLDAQIAVETRDLDDAKTSLKAAERKLADARASQAPDIALLQLEVEKLRQKRVLAEKMLGGLRDQRAREAVTIACSRASGS